MDSFELAKIVLWIPSVAGMYVAGYLTAGKMATPVATDSLNTGKSSTTGNRSGGVLADRVAHRRRARIIWTLVIVGLLWTLALHPSSVFFGAMALQSGIFVGGLLDGREKRREREADCNLQAEDGKGVEPDGAPTGATYSDIAAAFRTWWESLSQESEDNNGVSGVRTNGDAADGATASRDHSRLGNHSRRQASESEARTGDVGLTASWREGFQQGRRVRKSKLERCGERPRERKKSTETRVKGSSKC